MRKRVTLTIGLALAMVSLLTASPADQSSYNLKGPVSSDNDGWQFSDWLPFHRDHAQSLWPAMAKNFKLEQRSLSKMVKKKLSFFSRRQDYMNELTGNAKFYLYYVYQQTQKRHMPAEIALLPMIESDYNPFRYSRSGAVGLWQMMPGTASGFGVKINGWYDGRRDLIASTKAALDYLAYLHGMFGSWFLAIAAYDAGEGTVKAAIRYNKRRGRPTDFWSLPLPHETKVYIPKLLALARIIKNPHLYNLKLKDVVNNPYFSQIKVDHQVNIREIAKITNTPTKLIRKLNPAFRHEETIPHKSSTLLVPNNKAALLEEHLYNKQHKNITWLHYSVKSDESLNTLAKQYQTSIDTLKKVNNLSDNTLHAGQLLLIPMASRVKPVQHSTVAQAKISEDKILGPKRIVYRAKSYDTLSKIANHYHVTVDQISDWNNLSQHSHLHKNQEIIIWKRQPQAELHSHKQNGYNLYRVKKGDNLSKIAHRFHTKISKIKAVNHLRTSHIKDRQRLYIPT